MKEILRKIFISAFLVGILVYGTDKIYNELTDGFSVSQILYSHPYVPSWETASNPEVEEILNQDFRYIGKGCQSYAFLSDDGDYVLKFVKFKHFRTNFVLDYLTWMPSVHEYREKKLAKKWKNLNTLFHSWKICYEYLPEETGIVFLHLNKTQDLDFHLRIYDKLGFRHTIPANEVEFMVQKRADMLGPTLIRLMQKEEVGEAKLLISKLINMMHSEYRRGYGDLDQALMQNTGVNQGKPIHVDVGQIVYRKEFKNPEIAHQELFNRTYAFRKWLSRRYPELEEHTDSRLRLIMGKKFYTMNHSLKHVR